MIKEKQSPFQPLDKLLNHDVSTFQHSIRVAAILCEWGPHYSNLISVDELFVLGSKHDIGKLSIPPEVLNKKGALNKKEWTMIYEHPIKSYEMLKKDATVSENVLSSIKYHHENFDGTGYPYQLKGEEIPLYARMIRIADSFDALTSYRPYKNNRKSILEAISNMQMYSGTWYDPKIFAHFKSYIEGQLDSVTNHSTSF